MFLTLRPTVQVLALPPIGQRLANADQTHLEAQKEYRRQELSETSAKPQLSSTTSKEYKRQGLNVISAQLHFYSSVHKKQIIYSELHILLIFLSTGRHLDFFVSN